MQYQVGNLLVNELATEEYQVDGWLINETQAAAPPPAFLGQQVACV